MRKVVIGLAAIVATAAVAAAPEAGSQATRDYVQAAGQSDAFETLEADTALTGSTDRHVRAFAQRMIEDHGRTSQALRQATDRSGLRPPPEGVGEEQAHLLGALQAVKEPEFDRVYWRHQVLGHRAALVTAQNYARSGDDPAVKRAATASIPVITAHLAAAEQMLASIGTQ